MEEARDELTKQLTIGAGAGGSGWLILSSRRHRDDNKWHQEDQPEYRRRAFLSLRHLTAFCTASMSVHHSQPRAARLLVDSSSVLHALLAGFHQKLMLDTD